MAPDLPAAPHGGPLGLADALERTRTAAVAVPVPPRSHVVVGGRDAGPYLDAHLTRPVSGLAPGEGLGAALLAPKGTLLGILRALHGPEGLVLDADAAGHDERLAALRRGTVGWDVVLETPALVTVAVVGPQARQAAGLPGELPVHAHRVVRVGGVWAQAIATPRGADLRVAADHGEALGRALHAAGVPVADAGLHDLLRVQDGVPRFGVDVDERTLPAEAGIVPALVATDAGTYPGLQTVLRQQRSGTVHRALRRLRPQAPVAAGDAVVAGDREVGRVGTAVVAPDGAPAALALLRTEAAPEDAVRVGAAGVPATVEALPPRA
ncbi:hypothetical protein [Patulibacter sp. SYSU D01012]|uniref:hypothetical protein n=1 Tax=Patulibacter sp. SYSU D01012 TaxID=2817381 RepID=UPI001B300FAC|nr:hypothetical protein [Patulibacter sp. SYSU D01012]